MVFTSSARFTFIPAPSEEAALVQAIAESGARHVIVGGQPYRDALYTALPRGSVVARFGVGHEWVDKAKATASGLLCTNTPSVLDQSVAELTFLLLAAARPPPDGHRWSDARRPVDTAAGHGTARQDRSPSSVRAGSARPSRGSPNEASRCASSAAAAKGRPRPCRPAATSISSPTISAEALRQADFVSLLIPGVPENAHFINRERLSLMQPHAWLINTARGAVVDEAALYDALVEQRIGGAALDVFDREPYQPVDRRAGPAHAAERHPHAARRQHDARSQPRHGRTCGPEHRLGGGEGLRRMDLLNPEVLAKTQ